MYRRFPTIILLLSILLVAYTRGTRDIRRTSQRSGPYYDLCRDSDCKPHVCIKEGEECANFVCECVECRNDRNCEILTNGTKPLCRGHVCETCYDDSDCATDENCDATCDGTQCIQHSDLNCKAKGQYCRNRQCVDCYHDIMCQRGRSAIHGKPYCSLSTNTCHECTYNGHCRSQTNCNAICNTTTSDVYVCQTSDDIAAAADRNCTEFDELCYPNEGECHAKCETDKDCSFFQDKPYCNNVTGRCAECVTHDHCGISNHQTCNSQCRNYPNPDEYKCMYPFRCKPNEACVRWGNEYYRCDDADDDMDNMSYVPTQSPTTYTSDTSDASLTSKLMPVMLLVYMCFCVIACLWHFISI